MELILPIVGILIALSIPVGLVFLIGKAFPGYKDLRNLRKRNNLTIPPFTKRRYTGPLIKKSLGKK